MAFGAKCLNEAAKKNKKAATASNNKAAAKKKLACAQPAATARRGSRYGHLLEVEGEVPLDDAAAHDRARKAAHDT